MFPRSWISFGVLHGIALMLIVARFTASLGTLACGCSARSRSLLPQLVQHPFFDSRATNWIGLVTRLPVTEDYVPLLPWLGVCGGAWRPADWLLRTAARWLAGPLPRPLRAAGAARPLEPHLLHDCTSWCCSAAWPLRRWLLGRR